MNNKWQLLTEAAINLYIPTISSIIPIHIKLKVQEIPVNCHVISYFFVSLPQNDGS